MDQREIEVEIGGVRLAGTFSIPADARGSVLFAHGSGSSRWSPRNRSVADKLHDAGLATLLMDLLTPDEERVDQRTAHLRFDIPLLAERCVAAVDWLGANEETARKFVAALVGASVVGRDRRKGLRCSPADTAMTWRWPCARA